MDRISRGIVAVLVAAAAGVLAPVAGGQVLRVGSYKRIPGQFESIQAAVNAAKPSTGS